MVVFWKSHKLNLQSMKKAAIQGLILILLFFSIWFLLFQVNWVSVLKIEKITKKTEQKLGSLYLNIFKGTNNEIDDQFIIDSIDSLVTQICVSNEINKERIKIHVLDKDEVNAFALPDGHLVIYSGLILAAENQEELSGVICHEIAHIELNHVMKKLVKDVGISTLLSMATGGSGSEIIKESAKTLSSTAFDRGLEKEADINAVKYLIKANIDPEPYADFLYRLSEEEGDAMKYLSWINTHPLSKERAEYIMEHNNKEVTDTEHILSQKTWDKMKRILSENNS